jgi:type IX secretion system PorP/SprF family membrane protein
MVRNFTFSSIALVLFTVLSIGTLKGQDPQFTQFYANPLYLNPAFAGTAYCPSIHVNYRNQWPSIPGSFVTYNASYDQYVRGLSGGVGGYIMSDVAGKGSLTTNKIALMYSYSQTLSRSVSINFALEASWFQKSINWDKLTFGDQIDPRRGFIYTSNDVQRGGNVNKADFSAGVLLYSDVFFVGFAADHLTQPNESLILSDSRLPIKYTVHAGASINAGPVNRKDDIVISPNILYQRQGDFQQINIGLYAKKGPVVFGAWYRFSDAFILLLGLELESIKIGYSYDLTTSDLSTATGGSHEVSIGYRFDCKPKRRRFRTISCPSF